jgi:hypothetical protein
MPKKNYNAPGIIFVAVLADQIGAGIGARIMMMIIPPTVTAAIISARHSNDRFILL